MVSALGLGLLMSCAASAQSPVDYVHDIAPIFAERCQSCHGPQVQMKGLRLDDPTSLSTVVIAGSSSASKLILRVTSDKRAFAMPPAGAPLTQKQITLLKTWVDEGAKVPLLTGVTAAAPKASGAGHWSFQPVRKPALPAVRDTAWERNSIDRFVLARLEAEGLRPSPEADRNTLLRRLSLDLIGLPPTPTEVEQFVQDQSTGSYERQIDRLQASPHYGEKWARWWLDIAHYADSDGYEKDLVRPHAWRYRQWVIEALNRDMPFDQFTIDQIAGDELPNANVDQRVATGFLRNTLTNREAGVNRAEARFEQVIDRTNTVGTTWLGLTVGCAQCHNHKFDPISHKEYYQLFAFFNNGEEQDIDAPLAGELGPYLSAKPEYDRNRRELLEQYHVPELQAQWEARVRKAYMEPGQDLEWDFAVTSMRAMVDGVDKFLAGKWVNRTERQSALLTDYFVKSIGPEFNKDEAIKDRLKEVREKLATLEDAFPALSQAQSLVDDPSIPAGAEIHLGGDYQTLGAAVQPGTLAVLPKLASDGAATRLDLAKWIVSRDNPLTARVTVNRIWQELFGRGLVRTSEDFGTQGEKPTHPELLDWLASDFKDGGWSIKQIQKQILMSAAYRQASKVRPEVEKRDPGNELIARQSRLRLPAELVRDEALAASGLLNPALGGRSVRPPQPAGVAELGYGKEVKWPESTGLDRYRRGLYIHFQRTTPYPMLMNFDAPDSNTACTRRRRSNTPLQALNLLNDPVFFEAAQALAYRIVHEIPGERDSRIDGAFEFCLGRKPSPLEHQRLARYFDQQQDWVSVSRVLMNLDEFVTRE